MESKRPRVLVEGSKKWSLLVMGAWLTLAPLLGAQEPRPEAFTEAIDVTVINLEAVVTDKKGNPVTDLRPEDFVLVVDGQEVPVEYFSEIRERRAVGPTDAATPPETTDRPSEPEPDADPLAPSVPAGEQVGTNYLVFIDNYFSIPRDRNFVIEHVREQLSALGPGDQVAIVAFDGRELSLVSDWSNSATHVAERLEGATSQKGLGAQRLGEQNLFELEQRNLSRGLIRDSNATTIEERIRKLSEQVERVLRAATASLRAVPQPPGRKAMLLLSGGWPREPSAYVAGADPEIRSRTLHFAPTKTFEELVATANLLGYTLYPVDVPGRQIAGAGGLRTAGDRGDHITDLAVGLPRIRSGGGVQRDPPPDLTSATFADRALDATENNLNAAGREHEVEAMLLDLAEQTGGVAFLNGLRQASLRRAVEDTSSYYWLGFSPRRRHDDEVRSLRVEIKKPGLEVRSRQSFKDLSRRTEAELVAEGQLLFSTALTDATFTLELGAPTRAGRQIKLPVSLRIPLDAVVMLPAQGGYEARLELRVAALDEQGRRSEMPVIPVRFGGPQAPAPGAHAFYDTTLELRGGEKQRLVLSLHDLVGGQILTTTVELDPQ